LSSPWQHRPDPTPVLSTPLLLVFLQIYSGHDVDPDLVARASARQIERAIHSLRSRLPAGSRFTTTRERDLNPSQVAVLATIADHQESEFLAALESGSIPHQSIPHQP
jgi:hypothetical protein